MRAGRGRSSRLGATPPARTPRRARTACSGRAWTRDGCPAPSGAIVRAKPGTCWNRWPATASARRRRRSSPSRRPNAASQSQRAFLAIRLAEALDDTPLALELEEAFPGRAQDEAWLEMRLRLLAAGGRKDKAETLLRQIVRKEQASLDEARFRTLSGLAQDLGAARCRSTSWTPAAPVQPRASWPTSSTAAAPPPPRASRRPTWSASAPRWPAAGRHARRRSRRTRCATRSPSCGPKGAMDLPRRGLRRLPGIWPHAADWLAAQRTADRAEALAALNALPDTAAFDALAGALPSRRRASSGCDRADLPRARRGRPRPRPGGRARAWAYLGRAAPLRGAAGAFRARPSGEEERRGGGARSRRRRRRTVRTRSPRSSRPGWLRSAK